MPVSSSKLVLAAGTGIIVLSVGFTLYAAQLLPDPPPAITDGAAKPQSQSTLQAASVREAPAARMIDGIAMPPEFFQKLPPNSRIPLKMPTGFTHGIRLPDGSYLPLLNGVPHANGIGRAPEDGPVPPVVAKRTDSGGYEWYEHADGSLTTTRWTEMQMPDGSKRMDVVTSHDVPLDDRNITLSPPNAPTDPTGR